MNVNSFSNSNPSGRRAADKLESQLLTRNQMFCQAEGRTTDIPLRVKKSLVDKIKAIPEFQQASTEDLIASAKLHFRVYTVDRYSAIAALISNRRRSL